MSMDRNDYTDPQCPFCTDQFKDEPPVRSIDAARVIARLDEYLGRNDYDAAERHIRYWLAEAADGRDLRGQLTLRNELMGLMRKLGRGDEARAAAREALALVERTGLGGSVTAGTTYVNAATVLKAFGSAAEAIPLYEKARDIYEAELEEGDLRLGGLYNNMGLALADLAVEAAEKETGSDGAGAGGAGGAGPDPAKEYYDRAQAAYEKALSCMEKAQFGSQEQAITWLNIADLLSARYGFEQAEDRIYECLEKARTLLDDPTLPRDGYHAFICEKCAPTFGYYGLGAFEEELSRRAREIYEKNAESGEE